MRNRKRSDSTQLSDCSEEFRQYGSFSYGISEPEPSSKCRVFPALFRPLSGGAGGSTAGCPFPSRWVIGHKHRHDESHRHEHHQHHQHHRLKCNKSNNLNLSSSNGDHSRNNTTATTTTFTATATAIETTTLYQDTSLSTAIVCILLKTPSGSSCAPQQASPPSPEALA